MTHEATKASTRRVRFADSVGRELVTIFLVDLISNFYSCSIQGKNPFQQKAIEAAKKSLALPSPLASNMAGQTSSSTETSNTNQNQNQNNNNSISHTTTTHHSFSFRYSPLKSTPHLHSSHTNSISRARQSGGQAQDGQQAKRDTFVCDFTQPISLISFKERVRLNKVHLETCQVNNYTSSTTIQASYAAPHSQHDPTTQQALTHTTSSQQPLISISCTIRVLNLSFEKSVTLRYTTDDWHTFTDCLATYRPGSCDGWSDKFIATFTVQQPQRQLIQRIKFAIKYVSQEEVFWDSNGGLNYLIKRVTS